MKKHGGADRGGEPFRGEAEYPWFWAEDHDVETIDFTGGEKFKGRRYNNFHYSRAFKLAARRVAKVLALGRRVTRPATLAEGLARALLEAADAFERGAHWPAAVLWPDPERQFSSVFDRLRDVLAPNGVALYRLGPYNQMGRSGPAIWLRCLVDTDLPGSSPAQGAVRVFLLPGVTSAALKHPQTLAPEVRPVVELQDRGEVFRNRRQARTGLSARSCARPSRASAWTSRPIRGPTTQPPRRSRHF